MQVTMGNGSKALLKVKAYSITKMVIPMTVNGSPINAMVSEFTTIRSKMLPMKVSGKMTFSLVEEPRHGKMDQNIPVPMKKVKNRAMEPIPGLMAPCTKETGLITRLMELVSINGKMAENTMDIGKKTICMG